MNKTRTPLAVLQTGQVWELEGSKVQISMVGKLLVHYRHSRAKAQRVPISLSSIADLQAFLLEKKAILVVGAQVADGGQA